MTVLIMTVCNHCCNYTFEYHNKHNYQLQFYVIRTIYNSARVSVKCYFAQNQSGRIPIFA